MNSLLYRWIDRLNLNLVDAAGLMIFRSASFLVLMARQHGRISINV